MKEEALKLIKGSQSILLHLHPKPDSDSIGSALAMYHALRSLGKSVAVMKGDSELPPVFSFLPGYNEIILKNYFEIDLADFDLFIIQDTATKELISRKGDIVFPSSLKTVIIDHHKTNEMFADINLVNASYSATCEYLYDLFTEWGIEITKEIAACLYCGIYGDTGSFRYPSTTPHTMEIVGKICALYPDFPKLVQAMEYNEKKEKIFFDGLALSSIEEVLNGKAAISVVSFEEMQKRGIRREDSDNNFVASAMLTVKDWQVTATLIEKAPQDISISLRSKGDIDVSKIAALIGGGGHKLAAGITLKKSLEEAKQDLLTALSSIATL